MHSPNLLFNFVIYFFFSRQFELFPSAKVAYARSNVLKPSSSKGVGVNWRVTDTVSKNCARIDDDSVMKREYCS